MAYPHEITETFNFLKNIHDTRNNVICATDMNPSWVKVTTITITANLNTTLDIKYIREFFNKKKTLCVKSGQSKHVVKWTVSETTFYNQVSIYYDDHKSRKSVKLFPNGAVQVAGCSDLPECRRITKQIVCIVSHITKKKVNISDFNVAMINTNFSLNFSVNLYEVFAAFQAAGHDTTYNPDRYAAVKIKMEVTPKRFITASIFGSGKVIMTGAKCLEEISLTYGTIMKVICANQYAVFDENVENPEKFEIYRGIPIPVWLEKISNITIKNNV